MLCAYGKAVFLSGIVRIRTMGERIGAGMKAGEGSNEWVLLVGYQRVVVYVVKYGYDIKTNRGTQKL